MSKPEHATFPWETRSDATCPNCGHVGLIAFYSVPAIPVQSNLLFTTQGEAMSVGRADLTLAFCEACSFIANIDFDERTQEHSTRYEVTQGFSGAFNSFIKGLAQTIIDRHDVRNKTIVEIGCGAGEFLAAMCTMGDNRGYGIDPSTDPDRMPDELSARLTLISEYFSESHGRLEPDLICCRHTLEHIPDTHGFMEIVRRSIGPHASPTLVLEVPDGFRILDEAAFWDIYYEHCNYFCVESLSHVFASNGFAVMNMERVYDNQYLIITARPDSMGAQREACDDIPSLSREIVQLFREKCAAKLRMWANRLREFHKAGERVALWGSGSKAVGFLTTLRESEAIDCVVDINPHRQGMFSPGTGHEIVAPRDLVARAPHAVIIMNPVYRDEISRDLEEMGIAPEILTVEDD